MISGYCAVTTWAHVVLGLSVLVKLISKTESQVLNFGPEPPQVIINVHCDNIGEDRPVVPGSFLAKLIVYHRETQDKLVFRVDPGEEVIQAGTRRPAEGYASTILAEKYRAFRRSSEELPIEVVYIATAIARIVSLKLKIQLDDRRTGPSSPLEDTEFDSMPYVVNPEDIVTAARMLFKCPNLDRYAVHPFVMLFQAKSLTDPLHFYEVMARYMLPLPAFDHLHPTIGAKQFHTLVINMGILILVFSQITELKDCGSLPLPENQVYLESAPLGTIFQDWRGRNDVFIEPLTFFRLLTYMVMQESVYELRHIIDHRGAVALMSYCGWSIYLNTLADGVHPSQLGMDIAQIHLLSPSP